VASTRSTTGTFIVSLDIGSSSVRTLLYDEHAKVVSGFGKQIAYDLATTSDGGVEIDPAMLLDHCRECLTTIESELSEKGIRPAGIAVAGFWHSFLGVDAGGTPTTPVMHLLDTRSTLQVEWLKKRLDERAVHSRVGCVFHTSYWPARLLWLAENRPEACAKTKRWMSFGEYLALQLTQQSVESTSMMSACGLWNFNQNDYDEALLSVLPIRRDQLFEPAAMDHLASRNGIPWFPAIGDGAANNVGSGCVTSNRFALMVGTTGAMRNVIESDRVAISWGLWCYRIDRRRFVLGGALSDGGKVFEWMTERLAGLPEGEELERALGDLAPGAHGLTFLPLFAGERSPNWNAAARAVIAGISLHTQPLDLLRASLEAVALRFRLIYDLLVARAGEPVDVVATGGALLRSRVWTQMMADALGRPVVSSLESETSSRGAAMLALERLNVRPLADFETALGEVFSPEPKHAALYAAMLARQKDLYAKLYP
jgi:gluconokinase